MVNVAVNLPAIESVYDHGTRTCIQRTCKVCREDMCASAPNQIDSDIRYYDYHGCLGTWRPSDPFHESSPPVRPSDREDQPPTEAFGPSPKGDVVLSTRCQGEHAAPDSEQEWLRSSEHFTLSEVR